MKEMNILDTPTNTMDFTVFSPDARPTHNITPPGSVPSPAGSSHVINDQMLPVMTSDSPPEATTTQSPMSKLSVYKQLTAHHTEKAALAAEAGWDLTQNGQLSPASKRVLENINGTNGDLIDMRLYRSPEPATPFSGYHYQSNIIRPDYNLMSRPQEGKRAFELDPPYPHQASHLYTQHVQVPNYGGTQGSSVPSTSVAAQSPAQLPPCRVCGEKASGFHYGANTCEACKGFFRRSLQRENQYKCNSRGECKILPGKRHACAFCRFQKCIAIGMSKTAIKTGRYTHEKKNRDIEEVKRLELQAKMKKEGKTMLTPDERDKELDRIIRHITTVHLQQTPHTPDFFEKLPEREAKFLEKRALQEEMFGTMKPLPREEYRQIYQTTGIDIDGRREMITHMIPSIEKAIKKFIAFAKALPGFKDLPIDDQISLIKAPFKLSISNMVWQTGTAV